MHEFMHEFKILLIIILLDSFYVAFMFCPLMKFYARCCFMIRCLCKNEIIMFMIILYTTNHFIGLTVSNNCRAF